MHVNATVSDYSAPTGPVMGPSSRDILVDRVVDQDSQKICSDEKIESFEIKRAPDIFGQD